MAPHCQASEPPGGARRASGAALLCVAGFALAAQSVAFVLFPRTDFGSGAGAEFGRDPGWLRYALPWLDTGRPGMGSGRQATLGELIWRRRGKAAAADSRLAPALERTLFLCNTLDGPGRAVPLLEPMAAAAGDDMTAFLAEGFILLKLRDDVELASRRHVLETRYAGDLKLNLLAAAALLAGDEAQAGRLLEAVSVQGRTYGAVKGLLHAAKGERDQAWRLLDENLSPSIQPLLVVWADDMLNHIRHRHPEEHFLCLLQASLQARRDRPFAARFYARYFLFYEDEAGEWARRAREWVR